MMIRIAERLRPFSHTPGVYCLVPRSNIQVQVFPVLLRFKNLDDPNCLPVECKLDLKGPFQNFTVVEDLEKHCIRIFGQSQEGHVSYQICCGEKGINIHFDKFPGDSSAIRHKLLEVPYKKLEKSSSIERLSLGEHKAQDWDLVRRRQNLKEIFPAWFRLGQELPQVKNASACYGNLLLLNECERMIAEKNKLGIAQAFLNVYNSSFKGILVPKLFDDQFLGFAGQDHSASEEISPLVILQKGAALIRSLFYEETPEEMILLPCLPPDFDCGRLIDIRTSYDDIIDLEWSKKLLRRVTVRCQSTRSLHLRLQNTLKSFRIRKSLKDKGCFLQSRQPIQLNQGEVLFIDRFQK